MYKCEICGMESQEKYGSGRFCGFKCKQIYAGLNKRGKSKQSFEERFWSFVSKGETDDDCWQWLGAPDKDGYGTIWKTDRKVKAHRESYKLHNGDCQDNLLVCHSCDNTACVNPKHLFLGTPLDNMSDMVQKGRKAPQNGEQNNASKLTAEQVLEIRELRNTGWRIRHLALRYSISDACIRDIVNRKNWAHI